MPSRREILDLLKRDELLALLDRAGLVVPDRRVRSALIEALAGSRSVNLGDALQDLPLVRLRELCRGFGLDEGGRAKADLIGRLMAAPKGRGRSRSAPSAPTPPPPAPARPAPPTAPLPAGPLTREALERHLWAAADILRGSIDSSDYKNYILGMMFLKRISDRFAEESEQVRAAGQDPEDADEHDFYVPRAARWSVLQAAATGVGEVLNKAALALEEHNRALQGVLAGIDFNDERRLGDARQRDSVLSRLVRHFSALDLRDANLSEPDMLGRAYEYLIERFADDAGKKGGEFYTPHQVVRLMVEILAPARGQRICDPTCGSGGMLIQCARYVAEHGSSPREVSLYGQEKNLGTWAICQMNLLLHGIPDAVIEKGDTIRDPKLLLDGTLRRFDLVIANPPFSLDDWGREVAETDRYGRFKYGIPPKSKGDLAFVQHMVAVLNARGRMAVVMPHGVLFRGGSEGEIRKGVVEDDLLEAVIGLAPNLFYGTGIPAVILVLSRAKPAERRGKVLFVEASREFKEGSNQSYLRDQDVARIVQAVRAFLDEERFARVVTAEEIAQNDYNLNITRYVETAEAAEQVDVAVALSRLREAEASRDAAKAIMDGFLRELGHDA